MTFLKNLFGKTEDKLQLSANFSTQVEKAIALLENTGSSLDNNQFLNLLINNGIGKNDATEIYLFLPIAFVRRWLTDIKWSDFYIEYFNEGKQIKRNYNETPSFQIISRVTQKYFLTSPSRDTVLKIAGRSAEFHVINELLNKNPTAKLNEIELSMAVISR